MAREASKLAARLARESEAVCRHYLSNGRREGRYWRIGDARNAPGGSMFVRLHDDGQGRAAGKWSDAATGEHGDLLDIIGESMGLHDFHDVLDEARRFLALPRPEPRHDAAGPSPAPHGSPEAARRLIAASHSFRGTLADAYLRSRAITAISDLSALRFHPRCFYRESDETPAQSAPALIAAVTDLNRAITGVHRTFLNRPTPTTPPSLKSRRALGLLLGNGVRFGDASDVMLAGEGLETTLSLGVVMPTMPLIAALSAAHLSALSFPASLQRIYIACDNDRAGSAALQRLTERGHEAGLDVIGLTPRLDDFNSDLRAFGADGLAQAIRTSLRREDALRFMY